MKRIALFVAIMPWVAPLIVQAQDAAVDEHLNKISAQIQDLVDAKEAQNKRIDDLARQVRELQDQQSKPNASYASSDDLKQLADKLQEVDRKRQDDNELILKKIEALGKTLGSPGKTYAPPKTAPSTPDTGAAPPNDKGFEYVVQQGDTLLAIAQAYRAKDIKVSIDDILKANPGLKPERMHVGQKIFIPAPQNH